MRWTKGYIAVDWGTTNRRAWLMDARGDCLGEMADEAGILAIARGGFPAAVRQIQQYFDKRLPLLMAGMIGSNRGWIETPYVPCPAGFADLGRQLLWVEENGIEAAIVPGVSFVSDAAADVMRGEEVQILGAMAAQLVPQTCFICHPGTHNKWIRLAEAHIIRFKTVMTGELFNLLREYSIMADMLDRPASVDEAFCTGVHRGLIETNLTAELFSIRARSLLGAAKVENAASYTSGLLIGVDLRAGLKGAQREEEIIVMGRPELACFYTAALAEAGYKTRTVDGRIAFLAGIRRLAELAA